MTLERWSQAEATKYIEWREIDSIILRVRTRVSTSGINGENLNGGYGNIYVHEKKVGLTTEREAPWSGLTQKEKIRP